MLLTDYKVLTFDCYGTLIDWESGMIEALSALTDKARQVGLALSRDQILQAHARQESALQRYTPAKPYCDLLAVVYKRLAEQWGVAVSVDECEHYGRSIRHWPAFPDAPGALQYLKQHYKLVILSNVDNRSFSGSNEKLQVDFDAVYTAQDIGSYKPALRNFQYMLQALEDLGLGKQDVLHTAESLYHDHAPANALGLASCWIYRRHAQQGFGATMDPGQRPSTDFRFNSMADLVAAHQETLRSGVAGLSR